MATTKDDTTQGAVAPNKVVSPGGNAPSQGGGGTGPAKPITSSRSDMLAKPEAIPNAVPGQMGHVEQLLKTEPGLSQYALRSAIIIDALGKLAHQGNVMKYPFPDFLKDLQEALTQDAGAMDLMDAALAERMGATAPWVQEKMGPLAAQHMQLGAAAGSTPPQYADWSPSDLLHQYMMGPSAGQSAQMMGTLQAEAQGQGAPPGVPPNGDVSGWAPEMTNAGSQGSQVGRNEVLPGP